MTLEVFQTTLVRMIADPAFRDLVREGCTKAMPADLTEREACRLRTIAASSGLDVNRMLHKGFRLGKLRALLPLTCQALGSKRLGREASAFWLVHPPTSFYYLPEAIQFCDFLMTRPRFGAYVEDVVSYERATLELQRARVGRPPEQTIRFRCDPGELLASLAAGIRPRRIRQRDCIAIGDLDPDGKVRWELRDVTSQPGSSTAP
jgi:hypothetical protein